MSTEVATTKNSGVSSLAAPRTKGMSSEMTMTQWGDKMFSYGGMIFGPRSKMQELSVAMMCIDILSQDVSKAPLNLYRRIPNGRDKVMPGDHPVARVLSISPNPYMGPKEFVRIAVANLAVDNRYYVAARRAQNGDLIEIAGIQNQLATQRVSSEERAWFYDIQPSTMHERALFGWAQGMQSQRDVADIRTRSVNGYDAISTGQISRSTLNVLRNMNEFQGGQYENGGRQEMAFLFPDAMTDEQFNRLQDGIDRAMREQQKTGKPLVLEGNGSDLPEIVKLSQKAGDTEFSKSREQIAENVLQFFRVPPHKAFMLQSVKYDNLSAQERIYVHDTLSIYFEAIEETLTRTLLTEAEQELYEIGFDREKAYAMDPETAQKIAEGRFKNGMIDFDEMRIAIGENPVGGDLGKRRMIHGNFVMFDPDGEVTMRAGGNKPDAEEPKDGDDKKSEGLRVVGGTGA